MSRCRSGAGLGSFFDRFFIKFIRFTLFHSYGVSWTISETCPESVAKIFGNQSGFAVDDLDGAFRTSRNAKSATVALVLIDFDDISEHILSPILFLGLIAVVEVILLLSSPNDLDGNQKNRSFIRLD